MFLIIVNAAFLPCSFISVNLKSDLAWSLNVTTPRISPSSKEWITVLTECLTKSSLLNPSDYVDCPCVASESIEPEMSKTQMIATFCLF